MRFCPIPNAVAVRKESCKAAHCQKVTTNINVGKT
jgi:hypothetical protein